MHQGQPFIAHALNIQRAAAAKMLQPLHRLRRADQPAGAAAHHIIANPHRMAATGRADIREDKCRAPPRPIGIHHRNNLRNNIARALQNHPVPRADILARNLILIVQGGVRNRNAAHHHRLHHRARRQRPGAADLNVDAQQSGDGLLSREFPGNRPARRAADKTQPGLPIQPVELIDHAINLIGEAGPFTGHAGLKIRSLGGIEPAAQRVHRKSPAAQNLQPAMMRLSRWLGRLAHCIGKKLQRPLRGDRRIKLPQRPSGGIARIDRHGHSGAKLLPSIAPPLPLGQSRLLLRPIGQKIRPGHKNLAANFNAGGEGRLQPQRQVGQGAQIRRNILPHRAIAPRPAPGKAPILIKQIDRETIDLRLPHNLHRLALRQGQEAADAGAELGKILRRKRIVQAEHRHAMGEGGKTLGRAGPHPPGGAILADQRREQRLQFQVAAHQRVIFSIGNFGRIALMIGRIMPGNLSRQAGQFGGGFGLGHGLPDSRLAAAARAASVTVSPASMRAISSCLSSPRNGSTRVSARPAAKPLATRQ